MNSPTIWPVCPAPTMTKSSGFPVGVAVTGLALADKSLYDVRQFRVGQVAIGFHRHVGETRKQAGELFVGELVSKAFCGRLQRDPSTVLRDTQLPCRLVPPNELRLNEFVGLDVLQHAIHVDPAGVAPDVVTNDRMIDLDRPSGGGLDVLAQRVEL